MSSYLFSRQFDLSTVGEIPRSLTQVSEVNVILVITLPTISEFTDSKNYECK